MYLKQTEWSCDCVPTSYLYYTKIDIDLTPEEIEKFNHIFYSDPDIEIISEQQKVKEEKELEKEEAERKEAREQWAKDHQDSVFSRLNDYREMSIVNTIMPKLIRDVKNG